VQAEFGRLRADFKKMNANLNEMIGSIDRYYLGLKEMCNGHLAMAKGLRGALSHLDGLGDSVRQYHTTANTCSISGVQTTLLGRMELSLHSMVLEPLSNHLKLRKDLEARLDKKKHGEQEKTELCDEMKTFSESIAAIMRGPFDVLKRCQVDFMANTAQLVGGGEIMTKGANVGGTPRDTEAESAASLALSPPVSISEAAAPASKVWELDAIEPEIFDGPNITALRVSTPESCIAVFGQFGWCTESPFLFVKMKNTSKLPVQKIKFKVSPSTGIRLKTPLVVASLPAGGEVCISTELLWGHDLNQRMGFFERNEATTTEGSAEDSVGIFSATLICSIESSSLEFPMPLVLKLQPSHLTSSDFEHYWHSEWPQHAEDSGAEDGVTEEEPDDGKTKVCVRFEDPPHIIAYCRLHPDMLLCEARNVLLDDATVGCHLPNDWVYVKKGAPVGKKAEPKWHVSDTVPNIIIRNKSKEPIDLAALASKQPAATAAAAGRREVAIAEHSFRVACTGPASETQVVQRLGVANLRLAGRLETGLTVVQLLFATHTEHDFFLLRLTVDAQLPEHYFCVARASDAHLFAELEQCVRVALGDAASFATFHHIAGGGDPFYGNFIGVSLEDAVNGVHNDDNCEYVDYGSVTHEQTVQDWLTNRDQLPFAERICQALQSAGIGKGEWLHELIGMEEDGDLQEFSASIVAHSSKVGPSEVTGEVRAACAAGLLEGGPDGEYDYGNYGGASLEDCMEPWSDDEAEGCGGHGEEPALEEPARYDYGNYGEASLEDCMESWSDEDEPVPEIIAATPELSLRDVIGDGGDDKPCHFGKLGGVNWGAEEEGIGEPSIQLAKPTNGSGLQFFVVPRTRSQSEPPKKLREQPRSESEKAFDFDILALAAAHEARHPMDPEYTSPGLDLGMELDVTKDASIVTAADLSEYD
jgi:hypothetical protein